MKRKHITAVVGAIALMFAYSLSTSAFSYFIAPVTGELGFERATYAMHLTIMTLVSMVVTPFVGQLLHFKGVRCLLILSGLLSSGCLIAFSFCSTLWSFYLVAAIMGISYSTGTNLAAVIIVNFWFPKNNGTILGIVMAGAGLGGIVMSIILPPFLNAFGWRYGYLLLAGIWCCLTMSAAFFSGGQERGSGDVDAQNGVQSIESFEKGALFSQAIRSCTLYFLIVGVTIFTVAGVFVQHLPAFYTEMGLSDTQSGTAMSLFNLLLAFFKMAEGSSFERIGAAKFTIIISIMFSISFWILLNNNAPALFLGIIFFSAGCAYSTIMPPLFTARLFGHRSYPKIWGAVFFGFNLGKAIGVPLWGMVYDHAGSYSPGMLIIPYFILAAGVILLLSLVINKHSLWGDDIGKA